MNLYNPSLTVNENWKIFLLSSCLILLPFGRLVEIPTFIMALIGVWMVWKRSVDFKKGGARSFAIVFFAIWIPMLFALPDAANLPRTLITCFSYLRLFFAGLFVIVVVSNEEKFVVVRRVFAWVLLFWIADALLQSVVGSDILGYPITDGKVNGPFGFDRKMGIYLPLFAPFLIDHVLQKCKSRWQVIVLTGGLVAVLLGGIRAGWITLVLLIAVYLLRVFAENRRIAVYLATGLLVLTTVCCALTYNLSSSFASRVDRTLLVFGGSVDSFNEGISSRLPIWNVAILMISENPFNGVGPRGFRYAYLEYAESDDPNVNAAEGTGAFYAHQLWLEVGSETGMIGLFGLLVATFLLARNAFLRIVTKKLCLASSLPALLAIFPFNTHLAIYSSSWSQVVFLLIAMSFAAGCSQIKYCKIVT